jgi:hypothetical protein
MVQRAGRPDDQAELPVDDFEKSREAVDLTVDGVRKIDDCLIAEVVREIAPEILGARAELDRAAGPRIPSPQAGAS